MVSSKHVEKGVRDNFHGTTSKYAYRDDFLLWQAVLRAPRGPKQVSKLGSECTFSQIGLKGERRDADPGFQNSRL